MKIVPIMAVHDSLLGFKNVNIVPNISIGVRGFTNSCTHLLRHEDDDCLSVSDLSLYHVGNFNLETGDIEPIEPEKVCSGLAIETQFNLNLKNVELSDDSFVDDPYDI